MKTAIIALTRAGAELALKLAQSVGADVYVKNREYPLSGNIFFDRYDRNGGKVSVPTGLGGLVARVFHTYDALVFVMACGIAVRSIAPFVQSKTKDPAVVVLDETGRFAISLLSGHIGGANRLAADIAAFTGGVPVITTATDIHGVVAFDVFAEENHCAIENIDALKHISSELVNGGSVGLYTDCTLGGVLPPNVQRVYPGHRMKAVVVLSNSTDMPVTAERVLYLRPRNLIVGIGCKRGKTRQEIEDAVTRFMDKNRKSPLSVLRLASLDLKAGEQGILEFCRERRLEFVTYPADRIKAVENRFAASEFVRGVTGVGAVAEACAVLAGERAKLVCPKTVYGGITLALAEEVNERGYTLSDRPTP